MGEECAYSFDKDINTVDKMKAYMNVNRLLLSTALLMVALLGCNEENPTIVGPDVSLDQTSAGRVMTGEGGRALYFFAGDVAGDANCSGACKDAWPVFYKETPTLDPSLKAADFATITRADGSKQTTFRGWPLYYYKSDAKAGDVTGDKVGNVWMVAKPNYRVMLASRQLVGNDGKNYTFDTKEGTGNSLFLVDSVGRTLYAFAPDKFNKNTYTKADLSNNATWPIFEVPTAFGEVPSALSKNDFATISAVGKTQLTYKGWPLYYFGPDQSIRGNTKGVSVPRPGVWPVVNATSPTAPN
jgi:predicted lipoprotein with Yx(FWY)xxD motif